MHINFIKFYNLFETNAKTHRKFCANDYVFVWDETQKTLYVKPFLLWRDIYLQSMEILFKNLISLNKLISLQSTLAEEAKKKNQKEKQGITRKYYFIWFHSFRVIPIFVYTNIYNEDKKDDEDDEEPFLGITRYFYFIFKIRVIPNFFK